eukprot:1846264-Karenia_brevis.AAC.1
MLGHTSPILIDAAALDRIIDDGPAPASPAISRDAAVRAAIAAATAATLAQESTAAQAFAVAKQVQQALLDLACHASPVATGFDDAMAPAAANSADNVISFNAAISA